MSSFSLASYVIRIRDVEDREWLTLDGFADGADLFDVLRDYLQSLTTVSYDQPNKKLIKLRPHLRARNRILTGIIETGEWGYASQLQNVTNGRITHRRGTEEAENFPFYFLFSIPPDSDRGVVILERFGNRGIRTQLLNDLEANFSARFGDLRVRINPIAPGSLIDQYTGRGGRVTGIRLIQFQVPDDIADLFGNRAAAVDEVYTEYIVHAKAGRELPLYPRIREVLEGRRQASHLVEIAGIDPSIIKLTVDFQGKQRTFDLGNVDKIRAWYDITNEVRTGRDGHPQFGSIDQLARQLLADVNQTLGL